jgi:hypothetical protein
MSVPRDVTMKNCVAYTTRPFLLRLALAAGIVLLGALVCRAGGPKYVAGTSYFDPGVTGQPLTWPQGVITYYTDQGSLSPLLSNSSANSFVASAFSVWTSVSTAALVANSGGSLAEDVNGTNVTVNADGSISMPLDIQPSAVGMPLGIIYDSDGSVTDALLGSGAGGPSQCFFNAVFGGTDNYGSYATYEHALIVMNGQCVQQASQLTDVEYRLVRVIGSVLGVGWTQLNLSVQTGKPHPTSDDYAGFPVMHFMDLWNCVPITLCYPNGYQLSMDDMAAVSRLYPVTAQNASNFPGKQVFSSATARIHGTVYFTDTHGNRTTPMQGVNVVARWIDPNTGQASRRYAMSSVSGFLFSGNEGNPITGFADVLGNPFTNWGSMDSSEEGFFDLSGLQPPNTNAQYQVSIEGLDPLWSSGVGPYSPGPVNPSGSFSPIVVTVGPGGDIQQDILMSGSAKPLPEVASTWSAPAALPESGDWNSSFNSPGDVQYFSLAAQSNRTLSVAVTALDEAGAASEAKLQPVIGIWNSSATPGSPPPAYTSSPFNQQPFGMTRLDAVFNASGNFVVGVSDVRGDGRPDYHYHAHLLYADSVSPARLPVTGGPVIVKGTGFALGIASAVGATNAPQLAANATQMILASPPHSDGVQNITISDPVSGASTSMTGVMTYGAAATDKIQISGSGPPVIVGLPAINPIIVSVFASDGVTPVVGATIGWSAPGTVQLSACGGAAACTVITDESGKAWTWATPTAAGVVTITATLAPGVYSPAKSVNVQLNAIAHSADIGALKANVWVSQGATITAPLTARVLSNGSPQNNVQVTYFIIAGLGTLSATTAQTNINGYATVNLSVSQIASQVEVIACVSGNSPCIPFNFYVTPLALQKLQAVAGAGQISTGQAFQPVVVRVTDSSNPPDPVLGAPINFLTMVLRSQGSAGGGGPGEDKAGNPGMPVILSSVQSLATTDVNGLANIVPSDGGFDPPVEVDVGVTAGSGAMLDFPLEVLPSMGTGSSESGTLPTRHPLWEARGEAIR